MMKLVMLISGLAALLCMGLIVIIFGQQRVLIMMSPGLQELGHRVEKLDATLEDRKFLHQLLQQQLDNQKTVVKDQDADVSTRTLERDQKKNENNACQVEKTKKNEELAAVQKDSTDTEATEKTEREAWTAEVQTLKKLYEEPSKVCDFVKAGTVAEKCPVKEAPPAVEKQAPSAAEKQAPPAAEKQAPSAAEKQAPPAAEKQAPPAAEKQA